MIMCLLQFAFRYCVCFRCCDFDVTILARDVAAVDSDAESAHIVRHSDTVLACIIMRRRQIAERDTGHRLPVSFLVIIRQRSTKRLDTIVQQARAGLRSFLPPAPSLE